MHNYSGLSGMKDDFAKMLYSSSSKFFQQNSLGHVVEDNKILCRRSKEKLDEAMQLSVIEFVKNREL